jgi:hypothetical protein
LYLTSGLTAWLSGSGETGETPTQLCTIFGKMRLRGAVQPLPALSEANVSASRCWAVVYEILQIAVRQHYSCFS